MARNIFVRGSGFQERGILGAETPLQCGRVVKEKEFKGATYAWLAAKTA